MDLEKITGVCEECKRKKLIYHIQLGSEYVWMCRKCVKKFYRFIQCVISYLKSED